MYTCRRRVSSTVAVTEVLRKVSPDVMERNLGQACGQAKTPVTGSCSSVYRVSLPRFLNAHNPQLPQSIYSS